MMARCVEERIGRVYCTIFAGLLEPLHFFVVPHLRVMIRAAMSPCMPIFRISHFPMTLLAAAAQMARQPRRLHLGILAVHVAAGVKDVPDDNGQEHWRRFQHIEQGLILRQGIAAAQSRGELNEPIDDSDGDGEHARVKRPCHPSPPSNFVQGQATASLGLKLVSVEPEDESHEENNEALLHTDATHVQV